MKIYTKTGDCGETSLFGGDRVPKNHHRLNAYGTIDELNSVLGLARTFSPADTLEAILERIQNELFVLGGDLATPDPDNVKIERIKPAHITALEEDIDRLQEALPPLKAFILPGGTQLASTLHHARTICRRAERKCYDCLQTDPISHDALVYLNRLSDLLFVMARHDNAHRNVPDVLWKKS